jgi:DNA-binding GntR family transcriptional regulator
VSPKPRRRAGERPFQADRVYTELRARLLRGEVAATERLVETTLAEAFNTSRTPVREALRRLEGDGHLVRDPAGSMRPSVPSVRSMREVYDVRIAVEELTVRRAAAGGDRGVLEALEHEWRALAVAGTAGPLVEFVHTDEQFHQRLAEASGNDLARRTLTELNERIRPLRVHDFTTPERVRATIAEHLEILDAVLAGEADAAAAFMRAHVHRSALVVRRVMSDARARLAGDAPGAGGGG